MASWLTQHWQSNMSGKVSRLMICHLQQQVSCLLSSPYIFSSALILNFFSEDNPFWLPLYGSICCRLVAQPLCMIQPIVSGQLKVKVTRMEINPLFWFPCNIVSHFNSLSSVLSLSLVRALIPGKLSLASSVDKLFSAIRVNKTCSLRTSRYSQSASKRFVPN